MHYLDNSATTPVLREAAERAFQVMTADFGNPSSQHKMGIEAAHILKESRETVSDALHVTSGEIIFTSCGTESTNMALWGAARRRKKGHILTTAIEHAATLSCCKRLEQEGFSVTYLMPDSSGHISAADFADALQDNTILASMMLVNNETGVRLPVEECGRILKRCCPEALFHIDAVQGLFRVPLTPSKWACDVMSISGHKIGAPKGIGALYLKKGLHLSPLLHGGGQENGLRSGTEALPNIAAFGTACQLRAASFAEDVRHVTALRESLLVGLRARLPWVLVNGDGEIPHVISLSLPGCKSEVVLRILESDDIFVSAGSACSRGKESHVLRAMGLDKARIDSAIRVSFAPFNTDEDVKALLDGLEKASATLKRG